MQQIAVVNVYSAKHRNLSLFITMEFVCDFHKIAVGTDFGLFSSRYWFSGGV